MGNVYGGASNTGSADKNSVALTGGTVTGDVYGGLSNAGSANENSVTLVGGTVTGNVVGGKGGAGVKGNAITLSRGADGKATTFGETSYLIGGKGAVGADVSDNTLTIDRVKDVKVAGGDGFQKYRFILAPGMKAGDTLLTATKAVNFCNSTLDVDFSNSHFNSPIWDFGLSEDNHKINLITLENDGTFEGTPVLSTETYTLNGILSNYTGTLNKDTKNVYVDLAKTSLADGSDYVKVVGKGETAATGNTVVVPASEDGSTVPNAIAALAASEDDATALTGNSVTVGTDAIVEGRAVGADSYAGDVRENTVTVNGTAKGFVAGGLTATGTADSNTVTLGGKTESTAATVGGDAYGGYSLSGAAKSNTLTVTKSASVGGNAYGGYSLSGAAKSNTLTVTNSGTVTGNAYGSYAEAGKADGTLIVQNGTVNCNAYGSYSFFGAASGTLTLSSGGTVGGCSSFGAATDSKLTMSDGTVKEDVYGGNGGTSANGNSVTISGGTVEGYVYGGDGETSATDNSVTISGGTVQYDVYGGNGGTSANGNKITLAGGKVLGDVFGGYADGPNTTATGNTITLQTGADGKPTTFGETSILYGGYGTNTSGNTLTLDGVKNVSLGGVNNFDTYEFDIADDATFGADDAVLKLSQDTDLGSAAVNVKSKGTYLSSLGVGASITLLESAGTLAYAGEKEAASTYTNDAETASIQTRSTLTLSDDKHRLTWSIGGVTYTFDLTNVTANDDALLTSVNTRTTKIDSADVTLTADNNKLLSLNKGETVTLLNDEVGTLAYTIGTKEPALDHTYSTTNANDGTATVKTAGTVKQEGKNLILNVDTQTYTFDISSNTKDGDTFLTSTNTGKTTFSADDVTLDDSALAGKLLSLSKGDTVYLLKDSTGTLAYTAGTSTPALDHTYTTTTDAGKATVATTGKVAQSGNDLTLHVDTQKYTFDLADSAKDGNTFITSTNTGATKIDSADVTLNADNSKMLSLNKGETVYLLKNDTAGTLAYTDTNTLAHTYTTTTANANAATVATTGAVQASGNDLVLHVDDVKYTFTLSSLTKNGDTILTSANTGVTALDNVAVNASGMFSLSKGDKIYLVKLTSATGSTTIGSAAKSKYTLDGLVSNLTGTLTNEGDAVYLLIDGETSLAAGSAGTVNTVAASETTTTGKTSTVAAGTSTGNAIAAYSDDQAATHDMTGNTATAAGDVAGRVAGAVTYNGNVTQNTVTVTGGTVGSVYGASSVTGGSSATGEAKSNTLTITGGTINRSVSGGSSAGATDSNTLTLSGGTVNGAVYGGKSTTSSADDNTVIISGGTYNDKVYGGYGAPSASRNKIIISGGNIESDLYGGYVSTADKSEQSADTQAPKRLMRRMSLMRAATTTSSAVDTVANDNEIILTKGAAQAKFSENAYVKAYGGAVTSHSGNTLTVDGEKNITLPNVSGFDNYNFYLPAGTTDKDTILHLTDTANTDMTGSKVYIKANGALNLLKGNTVNLIQKDGGTLLTSGLSVSALAASSTADAATEVSGQIGVTAGIKGTLQNTGKDLVLTITEAGPSADAKSIVETRGAQSAAVNMGSDFLVNTMMAQIQHASFGDDGFAAFGGSSGSSNMRYKTGSYVDMNGYALNAGIAKKNPNRHGAFTWGPFFETGSGNYDSYLDDGTHGSGDTHYTGGGLLARQDYTDGRYVEGSLRYGRTEADYSGKLALGATSYNTSSNYVGGHLGLAYQYEFGGDARAHWNGYDLPSPSLEGSSVRFEAGWSYKPTDTTPIGLDLGISGSAGKERGVTFHAGLNYTF
ncbi:MAG: hypothetical protein PUI26_04280 [Selenomonadaceae bacterium]|nr:hypothetical protein [Selenomonadaceae bacterium]